MMRSFSGSRRTRVGSARSIASSAVDARRRFERTAWRSRSFSEAPTATSPTQTATIPESTTSVITSHLDLDGAVHPEAADELESEPAHERELPGERVEQHPDVGPVLEVEEQAEDHRQRGQDDGAHA